MKADVTFCGCPHRLDGSLERKKAKARKTNEVIGDCGRKKEKEEEEKEDSLVPGHV